jgi:predicted exporter
MKRQLLAPSVGAVMLLVAVVIVAFRLHVTTDITHFLPAGTAPGQAQLSRALARSELTKTVVLTVGGADAEQALEAADDLAQRLKESSHVAWVRHGLDESLRQAVYELYYPRRFHFFTERPDEELPDLLTSEGLTSAFAELKNQLRLVGSPARALAPGDPLQGFSRRLQDLEQAQEGELELRRGQFLTKEGQRAVVLLGSKASAFDTEAQRQLQAAIDGAFQAINQNEGGQLTIAQSGAGRFAIASEQSIKSDITRITVLSGVGLLLVFLVLFRSARALALLALPLLSGVLGALAITLLIFGRIHGLTLAFGATLIGVCIDFAVHFQTHHALVPATGGPRETLRHIWPALLLGALTTVAGLSGLAWTSLPGIREIAFFSSTGVLLALVATRVFLPPLAPQAGASRAVTAVARGMSRLLAAMAQRRRLVTVLPAMAFLLCVVVLPMLRWRDDIKAFQNMDVQLLAEQEEVQRQVGQMEAGRIVVARGDNEEEALQRNDEAFLVLKQAQADGLVTAFRSLHPLLWSARLQQQNMQYFVTLAQNWTPFEKARQTEGFRPDAFAPFVTDLQGSPPEPLRWEDLAASPLADVARPFRAALGRQVAFVTFLRGVEEPEELANRLAGLEGVTYFDQFAFLNGAYQQCRTRTFQLMFLGLALVGLMVLVRYRRWRLAAAAFLPALLAAATTLALVTAFGTEVNLLHLIGLLLVLSMGVDYGVFMVESRQNNHELAATAVAILVACLSTTCAFGLLGLSSNPALHALGLTTGLGVFLSLLLAPTALLLVGGVAQPAGSRPTPPRGTRTETAGLVLLAMAGVSQGCQPPAARPPTISELSSPRLLGPDFLLQQQVQLRLEGQEHQLQTALQHRGDELLLIGLTPFGTRAFVLRQRGNEVEYQALVPAGELPFPPRFIMMDIQRTLLPLLGPTPLPDGEHEGRWGAETVHERWQNGGLVERRFRETDEPSPQDITIRYGSGGYRPGSAPDQIEVNNPRVGYELTLVTLAYQRLEESSSQ